MNKLVRFILLAVLAVAPFSLTAAEPSLVYWNSDAGKVLRARILPTQITGS